MSDDRGLSKVAFTKLTMAILEEHHVPDAKKISDKLWMAQLEMQEKAPKKRKSGKSNWVKWAEKRNNNGGAKGVAEEMEMQEVEKEVAAEVRPVRKLNIKKKAPRFAALIVITSWTVATVGDSHDGMMVETDGYHLSTSVSIRPECSGQS